jgi:hypothetical protein
VQAWAATQPAEFEFDKLDQIVDALLVRWEKGKQLARWCKQETIFRLKGDKPGSWRSVKKPFTPAIEAAILKTHGDKVECIANKDLERAIDFCP